MIWHWIERFANWFPYLEWLVAAAVLLLISLIAVVGYELGDLLWSMILT